MTSVLNWAESATTKNPHTSVAAVTSTNGPPNRKPMARQHSPLTVMAWITSLSRPIRSAAHPPQTHPIPPAASAPKLASSTHARPWPAASLDAARNAGTHAHIAYSSHMCPRYPAVARRVSRWRSTFPARPHEKGRRENGNGPSR